MQYIVSTKDNELVRYVGGPNDGLPVMSLDYSEPPAVPPGYNGVPIPRGAQWLPLVNDGFSLFDPAIAPWWPLRGEPQFTHKGDHVLRSYPDLKPYMPGRA
jgi:hypothetical protein